MIVVKRNGRKQDFDIDKIKAALNKTFKAVWKDEPVVCPPNVIEDVQAALNGKDQWSVEDIQDAVETALMHNQCYKEAKAYILYREKHKESRFIRERIDYITKYAASSENAASNSNTDANANNSVKNVASAEGEVYKDKNRLIQRQMMKDMLNKMFPEVAKQYEEDLEHHIIYAHDEGSSPVPKAYCGAYTLYPLMTDGVGNMDAVTPTPPNDIQSFSGQVTNLVFALSAQTKGAVALSDYFVTLNYYVIKEYGKDYWKKLDAIVCNSHVLDWQKYTIAHEIKKGMKQFVYGVNQPAGNRSYQSPFVNWAIFDKYYFESLFGDYCYPDGTKPEWEAIDCLQRMAIALLREIRLIKPCTFPVLTIALLYDKDGYKDESYAKLCADEWAKGNSHFLYHSSNADSLSSCCRVQNKLSDNYFSSTTGMVGVMTGSCCVITLNINRIVQDFFKENTLLSNSFDAFKNCFIPYLQNILNRVYKYHIAYKTKLYELEEQGMITYSTANYLYIKKLYSTIGVLGYYEAAKFLGLEDNSPNYRQFIAFILKTISEYNKSFSIYKGKRPVIFNLEAVPGENLAVKLYNWDKADGYIVPEDQNLYNCYFFNPWKEENVLTKIKLHGGEISKASDGGQGCHINLSEHLFTKQYLEIMDVARQEGCNYFTFNIPMSECEDCHHVVNAPITECPICHSKRISYYTRIIGFLTKVSNWSKERQIEFTKRYFGHA